MKISPIIACYRDAEAVPIMYERLVATFARIGCDYEIIFVNDGSPDNAREVLTGLAARDPKVVVVNHARNFGSQSAFTSGMAIATGDACVLLDGDLQDPPELIEQFVERWREGYDVVYGERVSRDATAMMRVFSKGFYRMFRRAAYVNVPLDAGDFSLIDRRVMDALKSMPEKQRFVRGLRAWVGFKQIGVPYVRPERMFGVTTNSFRRNLGWARRGIVSFSYAPLDFITGLALAVVALSALGLVTQIVLKIVVPHAAPPGLTTVITLVLFIGGIQLLCLAIIGSYIAHMYEEVKGRPAYIVDSVFNAPAGAPLDASALERGRHELRSAVAKPIESR
ncbi:MAG: polyisoprenyl-phosphate glycosyltransferase [Solirubrobacteraceae bacterium]|jgi:dolichol-phosphate mannosyltransferase|nr:polyisoprenyl-phosphate glycosyltransferase [Solirubrobacteraceae bacterium]